MKSLDALREKRREKERERERDGGREGEKWEGEERESVKMFEQRTTESPVFSPNSVLKWPSGWSRLTRG